MILMKKKSCVGNARYFYLNGEYTEEIADMIQQINHLNLDNSFIQQQHDQHLSHLC